MNIFCFLNTVRKFVFSLTHRSVNDVIVTDVVMTSCLWRSSYITRRKQKCHRHSWKAGGITRELACRLLRKCIWHWTVRIHVYVRENDLLVGFSFYEFCQGHLDSDYCTRNAACKYQTSNIWAATWQNQNVTVRPAKTQISLGIRPAWSESSLFAWRKLGSLTTH